ncbi:hypothetical protein F4808DRAFT_408824 [Astrocystis sublimbata]|nr:hypothetical protein F4808DRAFT_408824 [Astrocystis sublimbata]
MSILRDSFLQMFSTKYTVLLILTCSLTDAFYLGLTPFSSGVFSHTAKPKEAATPPLLIALLCSNEVAQSSAFLLKRIGTTNPHGPSYALLRESLPIIKMRYALGSPTYALAY